MKLDYKVSYLNDWSKDGTHYNQTITVFVPNTKILKYLINDKIMTYKENSGNWVVKTYFKELKEGKNYITLSLKEYIVINFLNPEDTRIKRDRNTIINVKIGKIKD